MKILIVCSFMLSTGLVFAQTDMDTRIAIIEERIGELESLLNTPDPPPMNLDIENFSFMRFQVREASIGFEVVGEVTAQESYDRVRFRATLYAGDGAIIETETFSIKNVGLKPTTFDALIPSDYKLGDVESVALQVEDR